MSPRAYDRRLRLAAAEEARRRIVEATAALHAERGVSGTSHAMIAKRAGVSIPTVYKYFPTRDDLIPACTGWVAGRAPLALDDGIFAGLNRVPERVLALVRAVYRLHAYFAPWLRWSESDAGSLPALRSFLEDARNGRAAMIRRALAPKPARAEVLLAQVLLEFSSWRLLTSSGLTSDQAADLVGDAILRLRRARLNRKETS